MDIATAAKILMLPMASGRHTSHRQALEKMAQFLTEDGHKISFLLGEEFPVKQPYSAIYYKSKTENYAEFPRTDTSSSPLTIITGLLSQVRYCCEPLLTNRAVMQKLKEEDFDLLFLDALWDVCHFVIADHLKKPFVAFNAAGPIAYLLMAWEGPRTLSWVPNLSTPYTQHMSFNQRLSNTVSTLVFYGESAVYFFSKM